jgi:hypothetical protein
MYCESFIFYYNQQISQQCIIYTHTCFNIFMSTSGSLRVRFAQLHKFFQIKYKQDVFEYIVPTVYFVISVPLLMFLLRWTGV